MEKYGTEQRLLPNQLYTFTIRLHGEERVVSFTSQYNPLFASVRRIRSDYRTLFAEFGDDHINQLIHDNSKTAMELSREEIDLEEEIPFAAKQYARYKTEYDLAVDLFLSLTTKGGQQDKQIGDLRIMNQVQTPSLKPILDSLKQHVDSWETQLAGMKAMPSSGVRAGSTAYPLETRVGF